MAMNEPTTIVVQWLATDHENAARLRRFSTDQGLDAMRDEAEEYFQNEASTNPTAEQLLRWGMARNPVRLSRYELVTWVLGNVDWQYVAASLTQREP